MKNWRKGRDGLRWLRFSKPDIQREAFFKNKLAFWAGERSWEKEEK
jgi:hypothetical protein